MADLDPAWRLACNSSSAAETQVCSSTGFKLVRGLFKQMQALRSLTFGGELDFQMDRGLRLWVSAGRKVSLVESAPACMREHAKHFCRQI